MEYNRVICGNSAQVLKEFPAECIDMTVTSPPYDNLRTYHGFTFDFETVAEGLYRVTKPGGVVVWVVGDAVRDGGETGTSFRQALHFQRVGFLLHDTMIYEKNSSSYPARKNGNRYTQIFEYMFVLSKGKPKTANLLCDKPNKHAGCGSWGTPTNYNDDGELVKNKNKRISVPEFSPRNNIWKYSVGFNKVKGHPAVFPEQLAEDHIKTWSREGDVVLDPFAGSGTTLRKAREYGRQYVGIEISPVYYNLIMESITK